MSERLFLRLDGDPLHAPEADVPAGTMREFAPIAQLREHVASVIAYRELIAPGHEIVERVIPDGVVHLIFNLGDAPSVDAGGGFAAEVAGPSAAPALLRLRGCVEGVSVTLRAGAAASILGVPASEVAGRTFALDALWGAAGAELRERFAAAPDDAARVGVIQDALARRVDARDAAERRQAARAAAMIAEGGGRVRVRDIASAIGVGERRLQQVFRAQVGLPPRVWGRLARLGRLVRALRRQPLPPWSRLALDAGYYDQSHLVNDFRELAGLSPTRFLRRTVSGSSKTGG